MAKILIIDDSWLTRRGLLGMISGPEYTVIEAENWKQGLSIIEAESPACIILDQLMP